MRPSLRPLRRPDLPLLAVWLGAPHVRRWWREQADVETVIASYAPAVEGTDPTELLIAEIDGRPIGMVQRYLLGDNPDFALALSPAGVPMNAASIDYLIGEASLTGQGLGPAMIVAASTDLWPSNPEIEAIVVAVQQDNRPSWRALEKAGYRRAWSGIVKSGDPSDAGPSYVYVLDRPGS